jgi:hypothetical protein
MPNRWLCLAIVAFWLATTGWLFWTEVLPDLVPGQPPPFTIDLVDEAAAGRSDIDWSVYQDGRPTHHARTWTRPFPGGADWSWLQRRSTPDDYELGVEMSATARGENEGGGVRILHLRSLQLATARGDLLATRTGADLSFVNPLQGKRNRLMLGFTGQVREGRFESDVRATVDSDPPTGAGHPIEYRFPPVDAPRHGSVLDPRHPMARIRGLRPGQEWRLPMVDPVAAALSAALPFNPLGQRERWLTARVRPQTEEPPTPTEPQWKKRRHPLCLVIDYTAEGVHAHTWVEPTTGLVLLQQAEIDGVDWLMQRDTDIEGL